MANNVITADEVDVDFMPAVYDIIKCIERETNESAQNKRSEYQDSSLKVQEFQRRLESVRDQIRRLPGIEHSKEDQLKNLEGLRKQLVLKKKLLQKYKDMCALEGVNNYLTPTL